MVGRKRSNVKLPPRVYKDLSRYYYRPYLGCKNNKPVYGTPVRLGGLDASMAEIWTAYELITNQSDSSLRWLINEYLKSSQFKALTGPTQKHYHGYAKKIINREIEGNATFGDVELEQITKRTIRKYLDSYSAKVSANRHIQFLKSVYSWGQERYDVIAENPCIGVKLNKEESRDRYIEDWEYNVVYQCAKSMRNPMFAPAMELSYLSRARRGEVFGYTPEHELEEGLLLQRSKGSEDEITLWTERLKQAVVDAKAINADAVTPITGGFLFHDKQGKPFRKNALDSAWGRIIDKAMTAGTTIDGKQVMLKERFTFHDIKAKGITDHKDQHGGHKSAKMRKVYVRLPDKIKATR